MAINTDAKSYDKKMKWASKWPDFLDLLTVGIEPPP
jgi:hypothetical protein